MRKKRKYKKEHQPEMRYESVIAGRFINYLMKEGEKSAAEKVFYNCLDNLAKETKQEPLPVLEKAINNVSPLLEVISKRVGGANYQVPREVRPERKFFLACNWLIKAARSRKGKTMSQKLTEEILAAFKNEGAAMKKKQDMQRMAEANKAFAHFAR